MRNVLLAGATGYLGSFILEELLYRGYQTKIIVRNVEKINKEFIEDNSLKIIKAELTKPESIVGCCNGIDIVISTVGITKQKDGLNYLDVDYKANMNLLKEAIKSGVKKVIYVSVLKGRELRDLKICDAKEKFVDELKTSGLNYCIIRPNGFYSDISEFFNMAKKGRVYLFGGGNFKLNPIHGIDLAKVCVDSIEMDVNEIEIGGPEILTQNQIAEIAYSTLDKKPKITHIPNWIRKLVLFLVRSFTSVKTFGPIEFFLTLMAMDFIAPKFGNHRLEDYFYELKNKRSKQSVFVSKQLEI
jgi:uncharacterized protein YbjT (DUF2867 family)